MEHIAKTIRWRELEDEIAKRDYNFMNPIWKCVSPKERKANQVKWIYKYGDKEIKHLTSKQLSCLLLKKIA